MTRRPGSELSPTRRRVRATALVLTALGFGWALFLAVVGGVDTTIFGLPFTTNEPLRPLAVATIALGVSVAAHGIARTHVSLLSATSGVSDRVAAGLLAVVITIVGCVYCTTAAVGPDQYGYVSQADLWLQGDLKQEQPWVGDAPWPSKRWSFSPLGYRPIEEDPQWTIVPTYSPGLPLLMAGAKLIGGQSALFLVVPLLGGVMVLATYGIGQRLGSSRAGLIAAWLVATSPMFLGMLVMPMSDIPGAAVWAAAFYFLLGRSPFSAAAAGLLAALAILIRPNLFFLVGVMALWFLVRTKEPGERGYVKRVAHLAIFLLAVVPGVVAVGAFYTYLFGSPTTSGYGQFGDYLAWAHVWPNVKNYLSWFAETQTPVALAGPAALVVPLRRFWPWIVDRRIFVVMAAFILTIWAHYCGYLVFDDWRFLRFFLPSWPFLMLGVAAVGLVMARSARPGVALTAIGLLLWLGVWGVRFAARGAAFEMWKGDRRSVSLAQLVHQSTEPGSVVLTMIHSGAVRYYGSRITLRYDILDADWLDRGVEWMTAHGVHVYAALDEWELGEFKKRFAGQRLTQVLETPVIEHRGLSPAFIFDFSRPPAPLTQPRVVTETFANRLRAVPPAPRPSLSFK